MKFDVQFYWTLFLRRLPVMMALFLVCVVTSGISAVKLPPTYTSFAVLLVDEPQIAGDMVDTIVTTDASEQLRIIQQRLMTRANLLEIARDTRVFRNVRNMQPDTVIASMRKRTTLRQPPTRPGQTATVMRISFRARSPEIAASVVNEYVTRILQESNDFRMSRTESTLDFFEQEVEKFSEDIDLQSAKIVAFKRENAGALPGDLVYRQNRRATLQERESRLLREIASLEKQRRDMITLFEETGRVETDESLLTPDQRQLRKLRSDLEQALIVYSENNPRVTLLQNRIAQLAEKVEASGVKEGQRPATLLELTIGEMDQRIQAQKRQLDTVTRNLDELSVSIQATAANAITLSALERDFRNIQTRYNEAVRNLDRARVNERVEVSAQGQRITMLESPTVPQNPSGPNRTVLIATGAAMGLGLAVGFFFLLEVINRYIRRPGEIQNRFGIIPIAVIPYLESQRERRIRRAVMIASFLVVLIGVPAGLYYVDTNYMPLDILANRVFDSLGIT